MSFANFLVDFSKLLRVKYFIYSRCYSFVSYVVCKYFLLLCGLTFQPLFVGFYSFNFGGVQLINFPFFGLCFWLVSNIKNSLLHSRSWRFSIFFFLPESFIVLHLSTGDIWVHFCLKYEVQVQIIFVVVERASLASTALLLLFDQKPIEHMCVSFWFLYSALVIYVSISLLIPQSWLLH